MNNAYAIGVGMNASIKTISTVLFVGVMVCGCASSGTWFSSEQVADHNKDYRTFHAIGEINYGRVKDSYTADLVMYIGGNQFMVMEELIQDFQKANPNVKTIYVETNSPGQILNNQLLKQGKVNGRKTNQNPDLYASVSLEHLKKLKAEGRMEKHMIYAHNKLALMVGKDNPKNIRGPEDLTRDDLVQSHPSPVTEGIFQSYVAEMLKDLGIYEKVTGDANCKRCWAVPGKTWFTGRHDREIPFRIENGKADVGIVWATDIIEAKAQGRMIDGVSIPEPYNKADKVAYAIGILNNATNHANAELYLSYLQTRRAQQIYARYGFVSATEEELEPRPL